VDQWPLLEKLLLGQALDGERDHVVLLRKPIRRGP
jgi:hypothetical protein